MSLFRNMIVSCPACGAEVKFEAVNSVNADRRPDLRNEILNGSFQFNTCEKCHTSFRLDPEMTYLDIGRGQWIAVHPFCYIGDWQSLEVSDQAAFDRGYGANAAPAAKALGRGLQPRMVFGWAALREKLLAVDCRLVDLELELTKMAVLRSGGEVPLTAQTELRLMDVEDDQMVMAWIVAETGAVAQVLKVPRGLYDEIAADREGWQALREELRGRMFVDMQRLMIVSA